MKKLTIITAAIFATLLMSFKTADLPKSNDLPKTKRIAIVISNPAISDVTKNGWFCYTLLGVAQPP